MATTDVERTMQDLAERNRRYTVSVSPTETKIIDGGPRGVRRPRMFDVHYTFSPAGDLVKKEQKWAPSLTR